MIVIPVMDVKSGVVVQAVRGLRELYKPLSNSIYGTCKPLELACKLASEGFKTIYIADLDSILGSSINEEVFNSLRSIGVKIIADIGVNDVEKLKKAFELADYPVIATESAPNLSFLLKALEACKESAFLSLDIKDGIVVSKAPEVAGKRLEEVCELIIGFGVQKVILIDFDRIGSYLGPNVEIAKQLIKMGFEVYVGGGVRGLDDIIKLFREGVAGVLVSSALHAGRVRVQDLKALGFI
ncbi:MAG: HisA/HisF-related TIM barrel protein [Candidatus Nezhaarchaeales archaeon]